MAIATAGCSSDVETQGTGGSGGGETVTSGSTVSVTTGPALTCTQASLCSPVRVDEACSYCGSLGCKDDGLEPSTDPAAVICTLEALRDRTPGVVSVDQSPDNFHFCGDSVKVTIIDNGTAWVETLHYLDLSMNEFNHSVELQSPAYYQACIDAGSAGALECLRMQGWEGTGASQCACSFCEETQF